VYVPKALTRPDILRAICASTMMGSHCAKNCDEAIDIGAGFGHCESSFLGTKKSVQSVLLRGLLRSVAAIGIPYRLPSKGMNLDPGAEVADRVRQKEDGVESRR
jgi:hypothetical protein